MAKLADPQYLSSFSALVQEPFSYNIVGWDSEDNSNGGVMSFSFYHGISKKGQKPFFYTTSIEDALRFVLEYPETTMFVAHNLEYDLNNLMKDCDYKYLDEQIRTPKLIKATLLGSKNFFYNSNAFFFSSLAEMGEIVNLPKLEGEEQDRLNPQYVIRDSEIVYTYMTRLQKSINDNYGIKIPPTIGGLAMSVYRALYMNVKKQITYNNPELLKAYYGGRTEIFFKGVQTNKIRIPDINSSYPNVMYKYSFPDTATLTQSSIETHEFGVGKFKIKVPNDVHIPVLPYRSPEGKLFFPVGTFTGYWTYIEVREAIKQGAKIIKEYDGVGTNKGCKPFKEFVSYFYEARQDAKKLIKKLEKRKDLSEAEKTKLLILKMDSEEKKYILNNLYGKFGQHRTNAVCVRRALTDAEIERKIKGEYNFNRVGPFFEYKATEDKPAKTSNYLWGIYVTSYARIELHRHLINIHEAGGTLLYCDTDSQMYSGELNKKLDIGSNLGQLEYETDVNGNSVFDMALFRQAKGYLICNLTGKKKGKLKEVEIVKVACKGVPTKYAYDFMLRNMATFDKPMRQREFYVSANAKNSKIKRLLGINVWDEVTKRMNLEYIKRKGEGITKPVNVNEIEALEENIKGATVQTYEQTVKDFGYSIIRKEPKQIFTKIQIPKDWRINHKWEKELDSTLTSKKIILLRTVQYYDLPEDTVWFSGYIQKKIERKIGTYLELRLTQFEGEILTFCSLRAQIHIKTFKKINLLSKSENLIGTLLTVTKIDDDESKIEAVHNGKEVDLKALQDLDKAQERKKLENFILRNSKKSLARAKKSF